MELKHKLEDLIKERGVTITAICKAINMPETTFRAKMENPQRWRVDEFIRFCTFLRLTQDEINNLTSIFLAREVE